MALVLQRVLEGLDVQAEPLGKDRATLRVGARDRELTLEGIWAGPGWPADVRETIAGVSAPWPSKLVVMAEKLSPGAIVLLSENEANWADETGRARILGPSGLVVVRDCAVDAVAPERGFHWSRSAISIAEVLLSGEIPRDELRTKQIADHAGWSMAQVSEILQAFDAQGWTLKRRAQRGPTAVRALVDADALLEAWAAALRAERPERRIAHRTDPDLMEFLRGTLAPALGREMGGAVTGWAAAELLAPFLTVLPALQVYIAPEHFTGALTELLRETGLQEVEEGGRVEFWLAPPQALSLARDARGISVASVPRVYADLTAAGGRAVEAAQHLKETHFDVVHRPVRMPQQQPPKDLLDWERACRERLDDLLDDHPEPGTRDLYGLGRWSVSYMLTGARPVPKLPDFLKVLEEDQGRETGWPPWWVPTRPEISPKPIDGGVQCWLLETRFEDPAHADFWRAEPRGAMFLLRGYQEDSRPGHVEPGTAFDLTLPVWRTGECLLHAGRLGRRMEADAVRFLIRWQGLAGRQLRALNGDRLLTAERVAAQDEVVCFAVVEPDRIERELPEIVQALLEPLYVIFDFFEPSEALYQEELDKMRERVR